MSDLESEFRNALAHEWPEEIAANPERFERLVKRAMLVAEPLVEDISRLKYLIKEAEQSGVGLLCPWCQFARKYGEHGHTLTCPLFTPGGEVR